MKGVAARGVSVWGGHRAPLRRVLLYCFVALAFGFLVLPSFVVLPISVTDSIFLEFQLPPENFTWQWYEVYFGISGTGETEELVLVSGERQWVPATLRSFQLALLVIAVSVPLGALAAYGLTRGRFWGKAVINAIIISPLIVPILITAISLFFFFSVWLKRFFDPLPAPDLPSSPSVPGLAWLIVLIASAVLVAATLALRSLPSLLRSLPGILRREPEEGVLRAHEIALNWSGPIMVVGMPALLLSLFVFLGEWAFTVVLIGIGAISLLGLIFAQRIRREVAGKEWPERIWEAIEPWRGLSLTVIIFFFLISWISGLSDHLPGGVFNGSDPIPPVPAVSPGLLIGHCVLAIPYVVVILSATLRGVDVTLDQAAASLGAGPFTALRKVIMPVMLPGIAAAALFAFLVSWDELLIALFFQSADIITLPAKIWEGIRFDVSPIIAAVATVLIFLTLIVLGTSAILQSYLRRKSGLSE